MHCAKLLAAGLAVLVFGIGNPGQAEVASEPSAPVQLAELPLELQVYNSDLTYVSSATKYLKKLSEVPGSVTVITEQEIREYGALNLGEILSRVCGVEVAAYGYFSSLEIRGQYLPLGSKVLVLEDGRIINQFEQGLDPMDFSATLDNVKQIEVIKGPSSALYGRDAYSGVVNIVTQDGRDLDGLRVFASAGKNQPDPAGNGLSQYYHLAYGRRDGAWDYSVRGCYWREFGPDLFHTPPNTLYEGERGDVTLKYQDEFTLRAGYHRSELPTLIFFDSPFIAGDRAYQQHLYLDLQYDLKIDESSHITWRVEDTYYPSQWAARQLPVPGAIVMHPIPSAGDLPPGIDPGKPQIFYPDGSLQPAYQAVGGYYLDAGSALNLFNFAPAVQIVELGSKNQCLAEAKYELAWPEHNHLLAGIDYLFDWSDRNVYYTPTVSDHNFAGYAQDEYHLGEALIFLGGVRYDYNTEYASALSPRLSVIYTPLAGLRVKALYGSAFRAPNNMERNTDVTYGPVTIRGNPALKPETIHQVETGLEYEYGNWLQAKGTVFYYETVNEITYAWDTSPIFIYVTNPNTLIYDPDLNSTRFGMRWNNDNSSAARGLELENKIQPWEYCSLAWNYAHGYQSTRWHATVFGTPDGHMDYFNATLSLHYAQVAFLNFYAHLAHFPKYPNLADVNTNTVLYEWLPTYDLTLGGTYAGWNFTLGCYNLLAGTLRMDINEYLKRPRTFRLNVTYAFKP
jgi:outer membrane receptor for ferrienterochelin and colicins